MKLTTVLKSLAAVLLLPGAASAAEWTSGFYDAPLDFLNKDDPQFGATFNLQLDGFNPDTMYIDSASAWFAFADDNYDYYDEYVDISIEGVLVKDNIEVDGSHYNAPHNYDWVEVVLDQTLINNLQEDGKLSFLVQISHISSKKDVYLKIAHLVATGGDNPPTSSVPDAGATVLLVGLGLTSMVALRRRKS